MHACIQQFQSALCPKTSVCFTKDNISSTVMGLQQNSRDCEIYTVNICETTTVQ